MERPRFVSAHQKRIAALGGFLEGISYLNRGSRSDFASAFVVDAPDDENVLTQIRSIFSHLPGLSVKLDRNFQGGIAQLEHDIRMFLLVEPHVGDEQLAENMRRYLSSKIMDRLDDIINDWEHMECDSPFLRYDETKRFIGTYDDHLGQMIFYLLRYGDVTYVLYFYSSTKRF